MLRYAALFRYPTTFARRLLRLSSERILAS